MKVKVKTLVRNDVSGGLKRLFADKPKCGAAKLWDFLDFRKKTLEAQDSAEQTRQALLLQFGEPASEQGMVAIKAENIPAFNKELEALFEKEVELPDFTLKVEELKVEEYTVDELGGLAELSLLVR